MESVRDKVVLITGASSGIGAATAKLFAEYGAKLALTGRNKDNLERVAQKCVANGVSRSHVLTVLADLTKEEDVTRLWNETSQHFKKLDILVNNAGMGFVVSLRATTLSQFDAMININTRCMIQLSQLAIPSLIESKGTIINVSSLASMRASVGTGPYGLAKVAVNMLTTSLALELGPLGVRVNAVCPGSVDTPMLRNPNLPKEKTDKFMEMMAKRHPLQNYAQPEDLANAIVFLASDAARAITGVILPVDGGLSIASPWFESETQSILRRAAKDAKSKM